MLRIRDSIQKILDGLRVLYDQLATLLSEATVNPESITPPLEALVVSCCSTMYFSPYVLLPTYATWLRDKRDELNKHYVQCTKLDVALNGMLQRAKPLVFH